MSVADLMQLKIVGRLQDQNCVQTLCYEISQQAAGEEAIAKQLCIAWYSTHGTAFLARCSEDYTLVGLKAFGLTGDPKVPGQSLLNGAGTVAESCPTAMIARTITLYPEEISNHHRGRIMIPGTVDSMLDNEDGSVEDDEVTAMQALADALLEGCDDGGGNAFDLRIWGKVAGVPQKFDINAVVAQKTPAAIRSRRIRELLIG